MIFVILYSFKNIFLKNFLFKKIIDLTRSKIQKNEQLRAAKRRTAADGIHQIEYFQKSREEPLRSRSYSRAFDQAAALESRFIPRNPGGGPVDGGQEEARDSRICATGDHGHGHE